jgi:hypothetical protein
MIITKNFIVINFPKTGSTYVRKVIKELYDKRIEKNFILKIGYKIGLLKPFYEELILPNIKYKKGLVNDSDQHGIFSQIPQKHRSKVIVSVVRCPYERFFSIYEFRFWEIRPILSKELINEHLPQFPNLTPDDFVDYLKLLVRHTFSEQQLDFKLGISSMQFIKFFFKEPDEILKKIDNEYIQSDSLFKNDIANITFLKQDTLNENLASFLQMNGFKNEEVDFVLKHKKVNVTKNKTLNRNLLITQKIRDYVEECEFFYINVLKNYNIYFNGKEN